MSESYDVAVFGGGLAGVAAALAASSNGALVALFERSSVLGGNASLAQVHTICGFYHAVEVGAQPLPAHEGITRRIIDFLSEHGALRDPVVQGKVAYVPIQSGVLDSALQKMMIKHTSVDLCLDSQIRACSLKNKEFLFQNGDETIRSRYVIDATGGANMAAAWQLPTTEVSSSDAQIMSYIVRVSGLQYESPRKPQDSLNVSVAASRGLIGHQVSSLIGSVTCQFDSDNSCYLALNLNRKTGSEFAPLKVSENHQLREECREALPDLLSLLASRLPGWRSATVTHYPETVGVRESRVLSGRTCLSGDDLQAGKQFEDAIAWATWPMEIWDDPQGARYDYFPKAVGIPLGCLISKAHGRLGAAGRCASADHRALGSIRVLGTAMATGQAIGTAAALAAFQDCELYEVDVAEIHQKLEGLEMVFK
ncbi:MAG: FAD-dependent oxidoreductase [Verrucomicrobiota bacterium]